MPILSRIWFPASANFKSRWAFSNGNTGVSTRVLCTYYIYRREEPLSELPGASSCCNACQHLENLTLTPQGSTSICTSPEAGYTTSGARASTNAASRLARAVPKPYSSTQRIMGHSKYTSLKWGYPNYNLLIALLCPMSL